MGSQNLSLLNNTNLVSVPFVKIQIGDYTFGVFNSQTSNLQVDSKGVYKLLKIKYPNYIQSLNVTKINGQVNTYTLNIIYPITQSTDPNFFEKVFSSVSQTRKIVFSYGDLSAPTFVFRNEEALITKVNKQVNIQNSNIAYTVSAVSSSKLLSAGSYNFAARMAKPSDVLKELLRDTKYGLQDIFYGMRDYKLVLQQGLIPGDDIIVPLEMKTNISILDYITYLVKCMTRTPINLNSTNNKVKDIYTLTVVDDTINVFQGPYFKITKINKVQDSLDTYELNIGYPDGNIVTSFNIVDNEAYAIYYNYTKDISTAEFVKRINDKGELEDVYAPIISSSNPQHETHEEDRTWWANVTEYPISATVTLRGLLRPAILMTKVRVNIYFFGQRYIDSGLYIVSKQTDTIGTSGYFTTLTLIRVEGAN